MRSRACRFLPMSESRRALRALFVVLVAYVALAGAHTGEFWPFSVFPMFSRAGQPWQRILVRELSPPDTARWDTPVSPASLPGRPYALRPAGIRFYDLTQLVVGTAVWDAPRRHALRTLFGDVPRTRPLLLVRARGVLVGTQVQVTYTPLALLAGDSVRLAPRVAPAARPR